MTLRPYVVTLALLAVVLTRAMPSDAAGSGGGIHRAAGGHAGHGGGGHGGHGGGHGGHGGGHWHGHGGGRWGGGFYGYPYFYYPYPASVYPYPAYTYPYPYYYSDPDYAAVTPQPPRGARAEVGVQAPAVQREVVHPNGKYVLYGDGVVQPWQWVWVPAAPPAPPPPR